MPSPADLVTLSQAQAYLGTSGSDTTKLAMLITSISMAILSATNRTSILPKTYAEVRDGSPRGLMLRNWPVQSVQSVTLTQCGFGGATILSPSVNGSAGYVLDAPDDPPPGAPQMIKAPFGGFQKGDDNTSVTYTAGYQVTGEPASIPSASPRTVTAVAPYGAWGSDQGVTYLSGPPLRGVVAGAEALGAYSVSGGVYAFSAADAGATVLISYGYIPADLANACLEWIADRLAYQSRIGMASKSLGGQETVSFKVTSVPDFVKMMIQNYTNVVPIG